MGFFLAAGAVLAIFLLVALNKRLQGRRQFDERSDVTKIVRAADRRRRDARTAEHLLRGK